VRHRNRHATLAQQALIAHLTRANNAAPRSPEQS
jgi:hypothetical protein